MTKVIYYFTGTGNSLKVAKDLAIHLGDVALIKINQDIEKQNMKTDSDIIGFVVPTIFSGIPRLIENFIANLEIINKSAYIFVIATHGDKNGEGIVFEQIHKILEEKKTTLDACFGIRMPHNMPAKDHSTTDTEKMEIFNNEKELISIVADNIKSRKSVDYKKNRIKSFFSKMTYNSINKLAKKNPLDKGFYVNEKCIGCTICSKVCPANNIEINNEKPKWKLENCQFCFACLQWCPKEAIQYKKISVDVKRYTNPEIEVNELFNE